MALSGRRIDNFDNKSLVAWSQGLPSCVSSTSLQKSSIGWPQQPPTEKVLKFNVIFMILSKNLFSFKKSK